MLARRDLKLLLAFAVIAPAIFGVAFALGCGPDVLLAAPVVVLALPLLAGRYFGEDRIAHLAAVLTAAPRRAPRTVGRALRPVRSLVPRGGTLLGASLAVRPPPAGSFAVV